MDLLKGLGRFAREAAKAIGQNKHELSDQGIYIPKARAFVGGVFRHAHAAAGEDFGPWQVDPNRMVKEGLDYLLNTAFRGAAQTTQFYLAPFSGNVTPAADWKGSTFAASANEFTGYTEAQRLPWNTADAANQAISNSAALAAATLTYAAGGPYNLYGLGLLAAPAKGATTGPLIAATRFATPRTNQIAGDRLALEYTLTAKDEGDV